jgi:hypothetical protein
MRLEVGRKFERDGAEVLALPISSGRSEFVLNKLAELRKLPALIIRDGEMDQWRFEGAFKHENRLYLHGPFLSGLFLEEAIQKSFSAALPYLGRLIRALVSLKSWGQIPDFLQTDSVYFLEDGGILFLPPPLIRELRSMRPEAYKMQVFETINHPDIDDPEKSISFSIAALLYRVILGRYPFEAQSEEEIHNLIRHARLLPLELIEPGLREELSLQILAGLGHGSDPAPTLERWQEIIAECKREGLYRDITEMERQQIQNRAQAERQKIARAYKSKVFWQKHWKTVVIVAASVVLVGVLAGSLLKNILAPRETRGMPPAQIVETYYRSMNALDHGLMEDCVIDGAGKETIREVVNIYVLSRVSLGYEGRSHILPADAWDAEGRPELTAPQTVYGVTDLNLTEIQGEPEPVYRVSFTKWYPNPAEEPGTEHSESTEPTRPSYRSLEISERVYLRLDRKDWVIYRFERL